MSVRISVIGDVDQLSAEEEARLFDRGRATDPAVESAVRELITDVRERGDAALLDQVLRFDRVQLSSIEVPRERWRSALDSLDPQVRSGLEEAARNIAEFHRAQLPGVLEVETAPGVRLGRRADPLESVGVYAPGGRASYPSSVLMGVVPARVASVPEVIVCSPAGAGGEPPEAVLAACEIAGATRVFALGGAGAVAAMALGTDSVPRVAKIVGPGNAFVTEAKRQLTGNVAIDCPAGPSEILIIADDSADPAIVAAELFAQAEHDPDAASVLVATDAALISNVQREIERIIEQQPRKDIIAKSFAARGGLLRAGSLESAVEFAKRYAPEHLLVLTRDARALLPSLRNAGTIFLGRGSSVAFGDYITGANHVLPTAALARAYSGLSTLDFVRWTTYQEVSDAAAARLAPITARLAIAEGLPAHAMAARARETEDGGAVAPARVRFREAYRDIELYDPNRLAIDVDLSDNTNLFGPSQAVRHALASLPDAAITRYPSVFATDLKKELAKRHNVGPENITTGCGSDDVIDSALRAFCEPGDVVAYAAPTFSMVPLFLQMNALVAKAVPVLESGKLDVAALMNARARIIYVCSPNNPTGAPFDASDMQQLEQSGSIVFLDEAYADFAESDLTSWAATSTRTVSLRTLSKAFALAGLRVGYAIGQAELVREIEKSRGPYKVNAAADAAALALLREDREYVTSVVDQVKANRTRLTQVLRGLGANVWPSQANFVLVECPPGTTASGTLAALRSHGVSVRPFAAVPHIGDCIRVSIGPWSMLERFVEAFGSLLARAQTRV